MPPERVVSIAIVDDDASVRTGLERLCRAFGLSSTVYPSGPAFIDALLDHAPAFDCLLLDAHMPGMTGAELLRQLDAIDVRIPTIVFTADDAPNVSGQYAAAGIVAFLSKPISSDTLFAAIEEAVGQGRSRR